MSIKRFTIGKPRIFSNPDGLRVEFPYSLGAFEGDLEFVEILKFDKDYDEQVLESAEFLHLLDIASCVLGVSYYKLLAPFEIDAPEIALTDDEQKFILDVYENGLGEFFARNNLKRYGKIKLSSAKTAGVSGTGAERPTATRIMAGVSGTGAERPTATRKSFYESNPSTLSLKRRILLPIGGGKDSLVSVQLLEKAKLEFTPFAVNPKGPIISSVEKINLPPLYVKRYLDPLMIELGKKPQYYNGHVPSTAINSMIASLIALLFSYDSIALSNERSASEGNIEFDGRQANHQHSKSIEFEKLIADVLSKVSGGKLRYFSLLRPFSEVQIATIFTKETRFDKAFSSCNQNFKLAGHDGKLWCCNCPKCHFVFLILALNMDKTRLTNIFGQNLLNIKPNELAYKELTGLIGHKPWECVGEILEAAASLYALSHEKDWNQDVVVANLANKLESFYGKEKLEQAMGDLRRKSSYHLIPADIYEKVVIHAH